MSGTPEALASSAMRALAPRRRDEARRAGELGRSALGVEGCADHHLPAHRARDVRAARERPRPQNDELPAGQARQGAKDRPEPLQLVGPPLEDEAPPRPRGLKALEIDAERQRPVVAGEAPGRGLRGARARGGQRVDAAEELLALLLPRRVAEALGGVERRDCEAARIAQREVGEARDARLVDVDDVEAVARERELEVGLHADRHAEAAAAGDWDRGAQCDHVLRAAFPPGPGA